MGTRQLMEFLHTNTKNHREPTPILENEQRSRLDETLARMLIGGQRRAAWRATEVREAPIWVERGPVRNPLACQRLLTQYSPDL